MSSGIRPSLSYELRKNMNIQNRPPRIALVGCSWFARVAHLPALQKLSDEGLVELVALCSLTNESIIEAKKIIKNDVKTYTDLDEMLSDVGIDIVDLVLPTPIIGSAIIKSLQAGKHVISEKPCSFSVSSCLELIKAYSETSNSLSWSVAENWPFKPTVRAVHNILQMGVLGVIESIDFVYKSNAWGTHGQGWRVAKNFKGGYILDSSVHFISMLRLLTGGIAEVDAQVGWHRTAYVANQVTAHLVFENKVKGKFEVDFTQSPTIDDTYNLTIKSKIGALKVNFITGEIILTQGFNSQVIPIPDDPWVQGGVYPMLRHCCESITAGAVTQCTPMDGLKDVAAIEAMIESSRIRRPVIPALLYTELNGCGSILKPYLNDYSFKPRHLVIPKCVNDIRVSLREAAAQGLKVRTVGVGQNWTNYSTTDGVSIDLSRIKGILNIDTNRKTIRILAGTTLAELSKALAQHGLCLPSLPFLSLGTVGGMVSTATHGTSPHWGTVSDSVISLSLVTATGELLHIDENSNEKLMKSARVSVGMLGVITELELQAIDMKWTRNVQIDLTLEEFNTHWPAIYSNYEHVWIHWVLGQERLIIQCLETSQSPKDGFMPYVSNGSPSWQMIYHHKTPMPINNDSVQMSTQYGVPLDKLFDVINVLNESDFGMKYLGREVEIKLLKHNQSSYLGPNSDNNMALFNIFWPVDKMDKNSVFEGFEEIMHGFYAKPHWGKFHQIPFKKYMSKAYANWDQFDEVRRELDPLNMFAIFHE